MLIHYWGTYISAIKHMYNHLKLADVQNFLHSHTQAEFAYEILPVCFVFGFLHRKCVSSVLTHPFFLPHPFFLSKGGKENPISNAAALLKP